MHEEQGKKSDNTVARNRTGKNIKLSFILIKRNGYFSITDF